MITALIIGCIFIAIFFEMKSCLPLIYEYTPNNYGIRVNGKYLDIVTYSKAGLILFKDSDSKLFYTNCLTNNTSKLIGIINEIW